MSPSLGVTIPLGVLVAYANGSNDVSKGKCKTGCSPSDWLPRFAAGLISDSVTAR
jgi:hypothetical protein